MVPVTAQFQAESALHPAARELLLEIFDQGWADPRKLHLESRRAAILLQEAKESIANDLGLSPAEIYFLGEISLGFHLAVAGLAHNEGRLIHSSIDRQEVLALASQFPHALHVGVNNSGEISLPRLARSDVLLWQSINAETGLHRPLHAELQEFSGSIFVDHTAYPMPAPELPSWTTALWDASSWSGPHGLSIFGLKSGTQSWRNPFPHLEQSVVPSGFSLPLAMASAVALSHWKKDEIAATSNASEMAQRIRDYVSVEIPHTDFLSADLPALRSILSLSFLYVDAERLQADLAAEGFAVDSGSACISANLEASHVLKGMGLLSQGNIRLRLHHRVTIAEIEAFLPVLKRLVEKQRE